jgi:hypothetical protein
MPTKTYNIINPDGSLTAVTENVPAEDTNRQSIETKAVNALAANVTFLALANPTSAQVSAQVKLLTRETSALIRLLLNQLTDTTGT